MNMWRVTAQEQTSEGWSRLFCTRLGCIQMHFFPLFPGVKVKKRMLICLSRPRSTALFASARPQTTGQPWQRTAGARVSLDGRWKEGIVEMKFYFGCQEQFARGTERSGGEEVRPVRRFSVVSFCQRGLSATHTDSVTASTRQASLHLHTECVPLYLFIHFHVAKCCHFDEWEMEPANCFHSTGQVSHALNLNVLLVLRSYAALHLLEAVAATSHTRVHRRTWRCLEEFFPH